jgi:hypothetical protein
MMRALYGLLGTVLIVAALFGYSAFMHEEVVRNPNQPQATSTSVLTATQTPSTSTPSAAQAVKNIIAAATTTAGIIKDIVTPPENTWKRGIATVFWVGEGEGEDNGYISNVPSAWDEEWMTHYGGVDSPENRCGFQPCAFTPKENPFYVALPYNDLEDDGRKKANAVQIPWNNPSIKKSVLKNRWIEVRHLGKTCYGQWQDVGPFEEDDGAYVFGDAETPKNTYGEKAGIDLSPALADCLGIDGSDGVEWRHVEADQVPTGDWKKIITTRS